MVSGFLRHQGSPCGQKAARLGDHLSGPVQLDKSDSLKSELPSSKTDISLLWHVLYRTVVSTGKTFMEALTLLSVQNPQIGMLWSPGPLPLQGDRLTPCTVQASRSSERDRARVADSCFHVHCIPSTPGGRKVALGCT